MKNIHIIPTPQPSKIYTCENKLHFYNKAFYRDDSQNIYITNDSNIKEGDWLLSKEGIVHNNWGWNFGDKKIILTTDDQLIKDGVQPIPDDFLEWFVENPSCEEIEVIDVRYDISTLTSDTKKYPNLDVSDYKIIFPQEDIIDLDNQQTIEEVCDKIFLNCSGDMTKSYAKKKAIELATWQQIQIRYFLYSEITERRDYSASKMCEKVIEFIEQLNNK